MRESEGVRSALLRFYDRNAANDQAAFPTVVSSDKDVLVIGSAAREWFAGQEAVRGAYGIEGFRIDAGTVRAWEHGDLGYAVNIPVFTAPNGATLKLRMTTIFVKEDGTWKLLHMHASMPVPDEIAMEHQTDWYAGMLA
jgi:ketosteroid isomerase-like protein